MDGTTAFRVQGDTIVDVVLRQPCGTSPAARRSAAGWGTAGRR